MKKTVILVTLWLFGLMLTFVSLQIHAPYLFFLSQSGATAMLIASLAVIACLVGRKTWRRGSGKFLIVLWCLPALSMLYAQGAFLWSRHTAAMTAADEARLLGLHFVIGYSSFAEVATLAQKGLIAGVYITRPVAGRTTDEIRSEMSELQARRRAVGLPPLIVAADQEGGIVSHLAPPRVAQPALAT